MLNKITICFALFLVAQLVNAAHDDHAHQHDVGDSASGSAFRYESINHSSTKAIDCETSVDVKVNGLVCDFCAQALKKVFGKRDEVAALDVNLDDGKIRLGFKLNASINEELLQKLILDSGYNVVGIEYGCSDDSKAGSSDE